MSTSFNDKLNPFWVFKQLFRQNKHLDVDSLGSWNLHWALVILQRFSHKIMELSPSGAAVKQLYSIFIQ